MSNSITQKDEVMNKEFFDYCLTQNILHLDYDNIEISCWLILFKRDRKFCLQDEALWRFTYTLKLS